MADMDRRELPGHRARGPLYAGGCASAALIVMGLPFMAVGVLCFGIWNGFVTIVHRSQNAPPWMLLAVGLVFFSAGAFVFGLGAVTFVRSRRMKAQHRLHRSEPWRFDHGWDPRGIEDSQDSSVFGAVALAGFLTVFLAPFNYIAWFMPEVPFFAKALVTLFDLILVLVVWGIVYGIGKKLKYGRPRLAFDWFPYFAGETLAARLLPARGISGCPELRFTLRCIEEREEVWSSGGRSKSRTVCDQIWAETWTVAEPAARGEIAFQQPLPAGTPYGTSLIEAPVRYWELEVTGEAPGIDFAATFPLPVYVRGA